MSTSIVLERSGTFIAKGLDIPADAPWKCGNLDTTDYKYSVTIEATNDRLSREGFVIENTAIHDYMIRTFGTEGNHWNAMSCENMAIKAAEDLCMKLIQDRVSIRKVSVTFEGSNGARITATCEAQKLTLSEEVH